MNFGVDYYPEHWPRERWYADARLMSQAGFDVVRMAEFAWEKIEPEDEVFDFDWLDDAIMLLGDVGIKVVLGTPTAAPPMWLVEKHPEILPKFSDGRTASFGGRHHDCQSSDIFRESVEIVVREMAQHYAQNPHVVGWQIDNELGNSHLDLCYCDTCGKFFQTWLEKKYGSIEALNKTWGTVFWSQTYTRFSQIPLPKQTPNGHNPALLLDHRRCNSDLIVDFLSLQTGIIREECPTHFITHNLMGFYPKPNYFHLGVGLDFVSHDQYPLLFRNGDGYLPPASDLAMPLDFIRGIKQMPFWIMEQQAGPSGWHEMSPTPRPGQLRLWAVQSVAHGADTVVFFRWRSCLFGTEQNWHGIIPHSGHPDRRYYEIKKTAGELSPIMNAIEGYMPPSKVAICYSYDQLWAIDIQPHHPNLTYVSHLRGFYEVLHSQNVPVDFVGTHDVFDSYDVLFAPLLFLSDENFVQRLTEYVNAGGTLILTMRSGVKDWDNRVLADDLPGPLKELAGITVVDYDCLRDIEQGIRWKKTGQEGSVSKWADIIKLDGASALAEYTGDFYVGEPAVTVNNFGDGVVYYVGTELDSGVMPLFVESVLKTKGISGVLDTPDNVEALLRRGDGHEYLFVLNHNDRSEQIAVGDEWEPILKPEADDTGGVLLKIPAFDIAVFKRNL